MQKGIGYAAVLYRRIHLSAKQGSRFHEQFSLCAHLRAHRDRVSSSTPLTQAAAWQGAVRGLFGDRESYSNYVFMRWFPAAKKYRVCPSSRTDNILSFVKDVAR